MHHDDGNSKFIGQEFNLGCISTTKKKSYCKWAEGFLRTRLSFRTSSRTMPEAEFRGHVKRPTAPSVGQGPPLTSGQRLVDGGSTASPLTGQRTIS